MLWKTLYLYRLVVVHCHYIHLYIFGELMPPPPSDIALPLFASTATVRLFAHFKETAKLDDAVVQELNRTMVNHRCGFIVDMSVWQNHCSALGRYSHGAVLSLLYSHLLWALVDTKPSPWFAGRLRSILDSATCVGRIPDLALALKNCFHFWQHWLTSLR